MHFGHETSDVLDYLVFGLVAGFGWAISTWVWAQITGRWFVRTSPPPPPPVR